MHVTRRLVENQIRLVNSVAAVEKKVKKDKSDWKTELLKTLETENKQKRMRFRRERNKQNTLAEVVRFTLKDDVQSLVRLTGNQLRSRGIEEIVPLCLLVLNKPLEQLLKKVKTIHSSNALSLYIGIGDLWKSFRRVEPNNTALMALLLLNTVRRWKDQRAFDSKSKTIEDVFDSMVQKTTALVKYVNPDDLVVLVTSENQKAIRTEIDALRKFYIPRRKKNENARYLDELELVTPLQTDCSVDSYSSNPFEEKYEHLFKKHLNVESSMLIRVKNTVESVEKSDAYGEELISEWDWIRRIRDGLRKIDPKDTHPLVSTCLELLPREKLVECLHFSALAACSRGQNLIGATQFQFDVIEPIMKELGNTFKKKMGLDENEIWKKVFDQYSSYFVDAEVSRTNTHREWWNKSCKLQKISPDYHFAMGNMDVDTRNEVCNVLINVLFEGCLFPLEDKEGKLTWQRAFSYRSISIEEESKLSTDARLSLSRMLSINSKLMNIFDKNPFEYIVFSTSNLPMTIPPRPWIDQGVGGPLYTLVKIKIKIVVTFIVENISRMKYCTNF